MKYVGSSSPLIIARLTPDEYDKFHEAKIPWSGGTGKFVNPAQYQNLGPYIASYYEFFFNIIQTLHWYSALLQMNLSGQWIVINLTNLEFKSKIPDHINILPYNDTQKTRSVVFEQD